MGWSTLEFGKHEGKTLPQVLFIDPNWFFWAIKNEVFNKQPVLKAEADDLNWKAQNILIPKPERESYEVEYFINPAQNKFLHFSFVSKDKPLYVGSSRAFRLKVIDMKLPFLYSKYDKSGSKRLLKCLKQDYFGDKNYKMTKARCENFFNDDSNFAAK
jgi:hypothetical protein